MPRPLEASALFIFAEILAGLDDEHEKSGNITFRIFRERSEERRWKASLKIGKIFEITMLDVERHVAVRKLIAEVRDAIKKFDPPEGSGEN